MKTKEKILQKSLELFNQYGVKEVTLRKVALALKISQGNLNYHFKTKKEIVERLYFNLVDELNQEIDKLEAEQPLLSLLFQSAFTSMRTLYNYRFLMRDFYSVLASSHRLTTHYLELQKEREEQYQELFKKMIEEGLIREQEIEDEYSRLYKRMNILGDNWLNVAILFSLDGEEGVEYYHRLLFESLYPYLTAAGKRHYFETIQR